MQPVFKRKKLKVTVPMRAHGVEIVLSPGTKNAKAMKRSAFAYNRNKTAINEEKMASKCVGRSLPGLMLESVNESTDK